MKFPGAGKVKGGGKTTLNFLEYEKPAIANKVHRTIRLVLPVEAQVIMCKGLSPLIRTPEFTPEFTV